MPQGCIGGGLWQVRHMGRRSRVVAYQMEMLSRRCGDTERLLHKPIRLVSIPIWSLAVHVLVIITSFSTVWGLASRALRCR
jgi:hypothetical protein